MRIGHGYDAHRFGEGRPLIIGGVTIPCDKGLIAHSDGDVLIHALCDAMLGAAALDDIGSHFPDTDAEFENIDSRLLLRRVASTIRQRGWVVANADMTVIAQAPKLKPYIPEMRRLLAADIAVSVEDLSIKATTTEGMGFAGRQEGIAAHAVVLIKPLTFNP